MLPMTPTEIQSRIDAKKHELSDLEKSHNVLVQSHNRAIQVFNETASNNQKKADRIQGAIDELTELHAKVLAEQT